MIVSKWVWSTLLLLFVSALAAGSVAKASPASDEPDKAVEAVRQMFVALANDDARLFGSVTSADFYAFDVGKRFDGDGLLELVKKAHASGRVYVWEVTDHEVHVDGNTAWVTYVNRGSIQDAAGMKSMRWLESAILRKQGDVWRIHFFHSTRVPAE